MLVNDQTEVKGKMKESKERNDVNIDELTSLNCI
jgi:hypothetical protein